MINFKFSSARTAIEQPRAATFSKCLFYFIVPALLLSQTSCKKQLVATAVKQEVWSKKAGSSRISIVTTEKTIQFGGYTWVVRPSSESGGPGPNIWSADNVWVDAQGKLHLKLAKDPATGKWSCGEVYTKNSFGFGKYQFQVEGRIDQLDKNVVLGFFNYSGNDGYDEVDIEFSRWGLDFNPMLNYSIWPKTKSTSPMWTTTDQFSLSGTYSTHRFTRAKSSIKFQSLHGFTNNNTNEFFTSICTNSSIISTALMPVHINLWLFQGVPPSNDVPVEVVIDNFSFKK